MDAFHAQCILPRCTLAVDDVVTSVARHAAPGERLSGPAELPVDGPSASTGISEGEQHLFLRVPDCGMRNPTARL